MPLTYFCCLKRKIALADINAAWHYMSDGERVANIIGNCKVIYQISRNGDHFIIKDMCTDVKYKAYLSSYSAKEFTVDGRIIEAGNTLYNDNNISLHIMFENTRMNIATYGWRAKVMVNDATLWLQ